MQTHFSRTHRTLDAESSYQIAVVVVVLLVFLGAWATWFTTARVSVYAATGAARLEVERENHPVDAPVAGRVVVPPPSVGRAINAGDVVLELDATPESLAQNEAKAQIVPAQSQLASLTEELQAQQRALDEERRSTQAAVADSQSKVEQAAAASDVAADEANRLLKLQQSGLVSDLDVFRAKKLAEERQSEVRSAEYSARLVTRDLRTREQDRLVRIAALKTQLAALQGTRDQAVAASKRLGYEIDRRQIRAPISGTLAEVSSVRLGSVVAAGDRICSIVPAGRLKVVGLFAPPEALGRIHLGQTARVRLEGFPWTQYGSADAHVSSVAGEVREGKVRVELNLDRDGVSALPFQHGLPAEVDVEIERISPATMVLRAIGRRMSVTAAQNLQP